MSLEALAAAIHDRRVILFAGGGISQNLGLPDFGALVRYIRHNMRLSGGDGSLRDYAILAEAYVLQEGKIGPLRSWLESTLHPPSIDITGSEIHNLIVDLDFPVIYTTNYDHWLEKSYEARGKPFQKIVSVGDLTRSDGRTIEIIKFHGDLNDDESIVLTETSYFRRMSFESPLDLRLRSDSLARPLLFLGYSLHDVNTRYLLWKLHEIWENSAWAEHRPFSYILMTENSPAHAAVLRHRGIEPLLVEASDPGSATLALLRRLRALRDGQTAPSRTSAAKATRRPAGRRSKIKKKA
ncbi:MAG TPA: SIR2 family protein [Terracidiphilus sp.]|nr:SIR2 family protein [Terracidiphilus sp.]